MEIPQRLYRKVFSSTGVSTPACKLCEHDCLPFDVVDFSKFCSADPYSHGFSGIPVYYYRCVQCECIFTDFFDDWSSEDFSSLIYNSDYIEVDPDYKYKRPADTAAEWVVRFDFIKNNSVLDFGAGSGVFGRTMNEQGYKFESYDPYSSNVMPQTKFDIVTAFEVTEHSPHPLRTFETILDRMGDRKIVIIGQSLQPDDIMTVKGNWWYIAPRNGHCTTYSEVSFAHLAMRYNLKYISGHGLYGFLSHPGDELSGAIIRRIADWN